MIHFETIPATEIRIQSIVVTCNKTGEMSNTYDKKLQKQSMNLIKPTKILYLTTLYWRHIFNCIFFFLQKYKFRSYLEFIYVKYLNNNEKPQEI